MPKITQIIALYLQAHDPSINIHPCSSHELGLQDAGLSIRLVKASDLAPNSCGMSTYDVNGLVGEIDVLRSDEYANLPGCLDGVDIPKDQLNTVIHEVMHMILDLQVSDEAKVVAISEVIQPRRRHK